MDPPGTFEDRGQIGVHVSRVPPACRHLVTGGRDLAQGLAVGGDVLQDDEHMHAEIKGQVLRGSECQPRRDDPLDGRVIGPVDEDHRMLQRAGLLKFIEEEPGLLVGDSHRPEDDGKLLMVPEHTRLPRDLGGKAGMRKPRPGKYRQLLPPHQGVHAVDGGDAGLDAVFGEGAGGRVDR